MRLKKRMRSPTFAIVTMNAITFFIDPLCECVWVFSSVPGSNPAVKVPL